MTAHLDILSPIETIKGVGPARKRLLSKLGIETIKDALLFFPRDYIDLSPLNFKQGKEDAPGAFPCIVIGFAKTKRVKRNLYITKLPITDGQNKGYAVFFNQPYIYKNFYRGDKLLLYGKLKKNFGQFEIISPEWIKFKKGKSIHLNRIMPVYPLTKGLSQKIMRKLIKNILKAKPKLIEIFPQPIIKKYKLLSISDAIRNIHYPQNFSLLKKARYRFVFQELLLFQLALKKSKIYFIGEKRKNSYSNFDIVPLLNKLPFSLTTGQKKVVADIIKDLESEQNMNRLIQGDVGSGKTVIAVIALYLAVKNGYQGAMMAPTEVLATQHYYSLKKYLHNFNFNIRLLKGGMSKKEREEVLFSLKTGELDIIVGTHALIQKDVEFKNLGMVITDEQHRFGVKQREKLIEKGYFPDVLVMSATPIPRTMALAAYADLDLSIIDTLPSGRQKVDTYVVDKNMRKRVYDFMSEEVQKGNLAYIVCPAVEENEQDMMSVQELTKILKNDYPEIKIGMLHGKMKTEEKEKIIKNFIDKEIKVLIATTVIEVGVNVPTATLMIIENAERFGLAQLHQLRGRVGRSNLKSYCILISNSKCNKARNRLLFMMKCHDGFRIAEEDLKLRGPGEFLGLRQHGFSDFKLANPMEHFQVLKLAYKVSDEIIDKGLLNLPEYSELNCLLEETLNLKNKK